MLYSRSTDTGQPIVARDATHVDDNHYYYYGYSEKMTDRRRKTSHQLSDDYTKTLLFMLL